MVALGGVAVSYERGAPVGLHRVCEGASAAALRHHGRQCPVSYERGTPAWGLFLMSEVPLSGGTF